MGRRRGSLSPQAVRGKDVAWTDYSTWAGPLRPGLATSKPRPSSPLAQRALPATAFNGSSQELQPNVVN